MLFESPIAIPGKVYRQTMKNNIRRILSVFTYLFMLLALLSSCSNINTGEKGVTAINIFSQSMQLNMKLGEISAKKHITVKSDGEFNIDDIEFVSDDESVAKIRCESTALVKFIYFTVEATGVGETSVYARTTDGKIESEHLRVTVEEDAVTTDEEKVTDAETEAPETDDNAKTAETSTVEENKIPSEVTGSVTNDLQIKDSDTVYITPSGKKYHRSESCAGKNATAVSIKDAAKSYEPCAKCANGASDPSLSSAPAPSTSAVTEDSSSNSTHLNQSGVVYITPSGKKYHYSASCAGKNAIATTLDEASKTHEPCKKCVK